MSSSVGDKLSSVKKAQTFGNRHLGEFAEFVCPASSVAAG